MNKVIRAQLVGVLAVLGGFYALIAVTPVSAVSNSTTTDTSQATNTTTNSETDATGQSATVDTEPTDADSSTSASEQSVQELTDSIERLEEKLELLIETLEAQNDQADDTYTEALGVSETVDASTEESFDPTYLIIAGTAVAVVLGALLLVTLHARQPRPQTVSEAVDAIVARNQQIYGVPKPPESD